MASNLFEFAAVVNDDARISFSVKITRAGCKATSIASAFATTTPFITDEHSIKSKAILVQALFLLPCLSSNLSDSVEGYLAIKGSYFNLKFDGFYKSGSSESC